MTIVQYAFKGTDSHINVSLSLPHVKVNKTFITVLFSGTQCQIIYIIDTKQNMKKKSQLRYITYFNDTEVRLRFTQNDLHRTIGMLESSWYYLILNNQILTTTEA